MTLERIGVQFFDPFTQIRPFVTKDRFTIGLCGLRNITRQMKLSLEIRNLTRGRFDKKLAKTAVLSVLEKSRLEFLKKKDITISLVTVSPSRMKKINLAYRKKNKVTDILSFSEYKTTADLKKERKCDIFLGEMIVCPKDILSYAEKNKLCFRKELVEVIVHGTLHLLGFRHGKAMFKIQKSIIHRKVRK